MFMRSLFAITGYGGSAGYTFDNQKEMDELMRKISMDVCYIIRGINPSRVILSIDSKSWRNTINIEENDGYKSSREPNTRFNWTNINSIMDEFLDLCKEYGFIVTKIPSAEGDDVMALWANEFLKRGEHIVTVSGDEDIRQLVSSCEENGQKTYSLVYNPFMQGKNASKKLYTPPDFNSWLNEEGSEVSIWNMSETINPDKDDLKRLLAMEKTRQEDVDGLMIRMRKIFCGDDGDDIPAIYTWLTDKVDKATGELKTARVTESKFEKIYEELQDAPGQRLDYHNLIAKRDKVLELIVKHTKQTPNFSITERLMRQIKLVVLDPFVFPKDIVSNFDALKEDALALPRPEISGITLHTLLQGTRYVRSSGPTGSIGRGTKASIFNEIDQMNSNKKLF